MHYVASRKKPSALDLHCLGLKKAQLGQCLSQGPAQAAEGQKKATVSGRAPNRGGHYGLGYPCFLTPYLPETSQFCWVWFLSSPQSTPL